MKGKDLAAMDGVTLEKGTRKELKGTGLSEMGEYGTRDHLLRRRSSPAWSQPAQAGAVFLHEAGHRFEEVSGSLGKFQQTKGSTERHHAVRPLPARRSAGK